MFYWFNIISVPEVYKFIKTNKVVECKNLYIDCETKGFAEVFEFLMGEIFYLIVWDKRNNFVFKDGIQYPVCHHVAEKFIYPALHVGKRSIFSKENLLETLITISFQVVTREVRKDFNAWDIPAEFLELWKFVMDF